MSFILSGDLARYSGYRRYTKRSLAQEHTPQRPAPTLQHIAYSNLVC